MQFRPEIGAEAGVGVDSSEFGRRDATFGSQFSTTVARIDLDGRTVRTGVGPVMGIVLFLRLKVAVELHSQAWGRNIEVIKFILKQLHNGSTETLVQ
jgi:hypothetical protein